MSIAKALSGGEDNGSPSPEGTKQDPVAMWRI